MGVMLVVLLNMGGVVSGLKWILVVVVVKMKEDASKTKASTVSRDSFEFFIIIVFDLEIIGLSKEKS